MTKSIIFSSHWKTSYFSEELFSFDFTIRRSVLLGICSHRSVHTYSTFHTQSFFKARDRGDSWSDDMFLSCQPDLLLVILYLYWWYWWCSATDMWPWLLYIRSGFTLCIGLIDLRYHCNIPYCHVVFSYEFLFVILTRNRAT